MAPVAGMLKERGFHVTGSDVNVYPPASTLLDSLGITWNEGYREENLKPVPDLCVIGNAISRGNAEVEVHPRRQNPILLDAAAARGIFHPRTHLDRRRRNPRKNHHHRDARLDFPCRRPPAGFSGRRRGPEFQRPQLWARRRRRIHHRRRRIRHRLFRSRPEISPLPSRRTDSHVARIRSRGHLSQSRIHRAAISPPRESRPAARPNSDLGRIPGFEGSAPRKHFAQWRHSALRRNAIGARAIFFGTTMPPNFVLCTRAGK